MKEALSAYRQRTTEIHGCLFHIKNLHTVLRMFTAPSSYFFNGTFLKITPGAPI